MSEMVLRLPSCYVDVESDEMEYIEGGGNYFTDMATLVGALSACSGTFIAYGALSYNKRKSIGA